MQGILRYPDSSAERRCSVRGLAFLGTLQLFFTGLLGEYLSVVLTKEMCIRDRYCDTFHNVKKEFKEGDRISYASRVYDSSEMVNLVDSSLEFWLTSGRYTSQFEKQLGEYLGVKYCSLVNSGSSANLNAFMALTSPLLGERKIERGDEIITVAAGFPTTVTPIIQYGAVPVLSLIHI